MWVSPVQLAVVIVVFAVFVILPIAIGIRFFLGIIKKDRDTRDKPN
jgi:hypothetical protein